MTSATEMAELPQRPTRPCLIAEKVSRIVGDQHIVSDASIAIMPGEAAVLLGPSGCGKTTLLCMLGLLDEPSSGRVLVSRGRSSGNGGRSSANGGRSSDGDSDETPWNPWEESAAARARLRLSAVGFVFQQNNLLGHMTARENVALPAWRALGSKAIAMDRASALLDRFGLKNRADREARVLSAGEAQRVAIARALVNRPSVVLCDEPTGSLDTSAASAVMDALLEVSREGAGLLVVTHDPDVAKRQEFRRTIAMRDGRLLP